MSANPDVLIVGAGAVGLTTAFELARAGRRVTILDRGLPGHGSSWAGAGIVPPGNPCRVTEPMDRLRAESAAHFPKLVEQLIELSGIDPGYRRCGAFYYDDQVEPLPFDEWRRESIAFETCDAAEVHRRDPSVVGQSGYFVPDVAQVRNPRLIKALVEACQRIGVTMVPNTEIVAWDTTADRVNSALSAQDWFTAGEYLLCSGSWTDALLARFGCKLGVKPIRGQIVLYRLDGPGPNYIHHAGPDYLVPRGDGLVLCGSTCEDVGFDARTTESAIQHLRHFAETFAPPLARAVVDRTWAGLRPGNVDGKPSLGRVPGVANLSVAAGHFRWGIAGAPATAQLLTQLLTGRPPFIPLEPFAPGRRFGPAVVGVESGQ